MKNARVRRASCRLSQDIDRFVANELVDQQRAECDAGNREGRGTRTRVTEWRAFVVAVRTFVLRAVRTARAALCIIVVQTSRNRRRDPRRRERHQEDQQRQQQTSHGTSFVTRAFAMSNRLRGLLPPWAGATGTRPAREAGSKEWNPRWTSRSSSAGSSSLTVRANSPGKRCHRRERGLPRAPVCASCRDFRTSRARGKRRKRLSREARRMRAPNDA